MTILYLILAFLFGLIFGSFLNVCIYRIPRDLSVVTPRSFCPECGRQLAWTHNIPLLSYLVLRGRCGFCSRSIPLRYPIVEFATAVLFAWIAARYGMQPAAFKWMLLGALLIVLFWTDLEERLLPDECTLSGAVAGLILACFIHVPGILGDFLLLSDANVRRQSLMNAITGALILAVPIWVVAALWGWLRKREALGLGDVKLLVLLGLFLGPGAGLMTLALAALSGSLMGVALVFWRRKPLHTYELPFGSFLCAAAIVVIIAGVPSASILGVL